MELTDYRERFPILASTTYLINHSLGAMPAEAERRLERFAHEWAHARRARVGRGLVGHRRRVGDLVGSIIGAPPGSTVMHQNVTVAEAIVLSCFDFEAAAQPHRLRGRALPVGALRAAGVVALRRRGRRLRATRRP